MLSVRLISCLLAIALLGVAQLFQSVHGAACGNEMKTFNKCMAELNGQIAQSTKQHQANADEDSQYQADVRACFADNGCNLDEASPQTDADKVDNCEAEATKSYKKALESCVKRDSNGDPKFALSNRDKTQTAEHRGFSRKVRQAYKACADRGVTPGLIAKCIQQKSSANTPAAQTPTVGAQAPSIGANFLNIGALGNLDALLQPFKKMCSAKEKCISKVTPGCTKAICLCFVNNTKLDQKLSKDLKDCLTSENVVLSEEKIASLASQIKQPMEPEFCNEQNNVNPCDAGSFANVLSSNPIIPGANSKGGSFIDQISGFLNGGKNIFGQFGRRRRHLKY